MPQCNLKNEVCGFQCTGYDGSDIWKEIHAAVEKIECGTCQEEGRDLMRGAHDLVNVGLGKKAYDAENFRKFADKVACAYSKCRLDGRC